jgi:hypothetical protein
VRSIEAHGFRLISREHRHNLKHGQIPPVLHYAVTADQWHERNRVTA